MTTTITKFSTDSGIVGDRITNDSTLALDGTATADSTVRIYDGQALLGTTTADASGAWSYTTATLQNGTHNLTAATTTTSGVPSVFPDASTTGVPPGTSLTTVNGDYHSSGAGQIINGLNIRGVLVIDDPNVIVRNCQAEYILVTANGRGCTIQDTTVIGENAGNSGITLFANNTTILRCDISGVENGIWLEANGCLIRDNYIHGLRNDVYFDPHYDGLQIGPGTTTANNVIDHNNFDLGEGANACIMIEDGTNIDISNNRFHGGTYNIYFEDNTTGCDVTNNVFAYSLYGAVEGTAAGAQTYSGNVHGETTPSNTPPVATINNQSLATNQWAQVTGLLSYSDANGNPAARYEFWDSGTAANSGYFYTSANAHWAANTTISVNAADLSSVWIRGGTAGGSDTMFVRAFDGTDWSAWDQFTLTTQPNTPPVATINNQSLATNQWAQVTGLLSYSDANGNPAVRYEFWDSGTAANSGYFYTSANAHWAANTTISVNAADLSSVWIRGGTAGGSDTMFVRAFDGTDWSAWDQFTLTTQPNTPPVATINNQSLATNQWAQVTGLLSYSDANGNPAVRYEFWDSGTAANSGYFYTSANAHWAANTTISVNAADLSSVWIRGGTAGGSDTMFVRAFDGTDWSAWDQFTLTTQPNTPPVATISDHTLAVNQWSQVTSWISYSDANGNPAVQYEFWDGGVAANSGYFYTPSNAHHAAETSVLIMASDISNLWVRGGAVAGAETMFVRAFDGTDWSAWDSFRLTTT